jgi:hypothetical protein
MMQKGVYMVVRQPIPIIERKYHTPALSVSLIPFHLSDNHACFSDTTLSFTRHFYPPCPTTKSDDDDNDDNFPSELVTPNKVLRLSLCTLNFALFLTQS